MMKKDHFFGVNFFAELFIFSKKVHTKKVVAKTFGTRTVFKGH